jgi:hypothetical protein
MLDPEFVKRANTMGLTSWQARVGQSDPDRPGAAFKRKIVNLAGGKCMRCGFKPKEPADFSALDFHHRDRHQKRFTLGISARTRSWDDIIDEMAKCDLVCANCHRAIHWGSGSRGGKVTKRDYQVAAIRVISTARPARDEVAERKEQTRMRRNEAYRRRILRKLGLDPAEVERPAS